MQVIQISLGKVLMNGLVGRVARSQFMILLGLFVAIESVALPDRCDGQELSAGVMKELRMASVQIHMLNAEGPPGYGIFVDRNIIVTPLHALGLSPSNRNAPSRIEVVWRKGHPTMAIMPGTILDLDFNHQIAFVSVKAPPEIKPILMRRSESISMGMPVLIVAPDPEVSEATKEEVPWKVTSGSLMELKRNAIGAIEFLEVQEITGPVRKDAAIIDRSGRLIGFSSTAQPQAGLSASIPCDAIKSDLEGRLASVSWGPIQNGKNCEVSFEVIDPRRRVRRIAAEYWESPATAARPLDPHRKLPTYGAAEDGAKKPMKVTFDLNRNQWVGMISEVPTDPKQSLWVQPSFITSRGTILAEAVRQHPPQETEATKAMAAGPDRSQTQTVKQAPQKLTVRNQPPRKALIGKAFEFKPELVENVDGLTVQYKLGRGVQGMQIDQSNGAITFQPSKVHLGIYDIVVIAVVEGKEHSILDWPLEIDFSP